jgi:hypothetical protein
VEVASICHPLHKRSQSFEQLQQFSVSLKLRKLSSTQLKCAKNYENCIMYQSIDKRIYGAKLKSDAKRQSDSVHGQRGKKTQNLKPGI